MEPAPVTVGIPTFGRGLRILDTLTHLAQCDPPPAEVIVHVDQSNGDLEHELVRQFPSVRVLSSLERVGPGGGRHRCMQAASKPFFVSFDDDSWPVDADVFAEVVAFFGNYPRAAVLAMSIYSPGDLEPERTTEVETITDYTGCGHAIRLDAYRETTGYIDRPCPYGIEEVDIAMQLYAKDWMVLRSHCLRVFHDTKLSHHSKSEIVSSAVQNVALRAFLRYPVQLWPRAVLQLANAVWFMLKRRRFEGLWDGLTGIPSTLVRYASCRRQLPAEKVRSYLNARAKFTS